MSRCVYDPLLYRLMVGKLHEPMKSNSNVPCLGWSLTAVLVLRLYSVEGFNIY